MVIKKIPFIFCLAVITIVTVVACITLASAGRKMLSSPLDFLVLTLLISIPASPGILATFYCFSCIKKPSPEKFKKATGYILVYPVIIIGGIGNSLHPHYGVPALLILTTLAAYFFWIAICRVLMKYQEYIPESTRSFWTKNFNLLLAIELYMLISHIFIKQLKASEDHSVTMMLSPVLFLLVPVVFYKILEKWRKHLQKNILTSENPDEPTPKDSNII